MAEIPWFAWIAIVAIIMWGLVMIFSRDTKSKGKPTQEHAEIEDLQRRITELEARLHRAGQ